jgi:hypothetical protein
MSLTRVFTFAITLAIGVSVPKAECASCSAEERAAVARLIVGRWQAYYQGEGMCFAVTFARRGTFTSEQSKCTGQKDGAFEGSWELQDDCTITVRMDGKPELWKIDFVNDNEFIRAGVKGISYRRK